MFHFIQVATHHVTIVITFLPIVIFLHCWRNSQGKVTHSFDTITQKRYLDSIDSFDFLYFALFECHRRHSIMLHGGDMRQCVTLFYLMAQNMTSMMFAFIHSL